MRRSKIMQQAKETIDAQEAVPLSIKRSAWILFQHQLSRINPATGKPFTARRSLSDTLKWMDLQKQRHDAIMKQLTPMQKQIITLIVEEGLTQKQIAQRLGLEHITVRYHMSEVRKRIGAASTYQVVAVAVEMGWINALKIID